MSKRLMAFIVSILLVASITLRAGPAASIGQAKNSDEVRQIFRSAAQAMGGRAAFEFNFVSWGSGAFEKNTPRLEGKVRVVLGPPGGAPKVLVEAVCRDQASPQSSASRVAVASDGDLTSATEESTRTLWRGARHQGGGILLSRKSNMFLPTLIDPRGLEGTLEYEAVLKAPETAGGALCDVVFFPLPGGGGYTYRFGQKDHLLRSIEWASFKDGVPGSRAIEISSFKPITPPADSEFKAVLPPGYQEKQFTLGGPAVGELAPAWTVTDDRKNTLSLASLAGNVVVMDFWATWCGPCKASIPKMQALSQEFRGKPVKVVGLTWNESGDARAYFEKNGVTYPTFPGDSLADAYGINSAGIPVVFVVGPDGRVVEFVIGYSGEETDRVLRRAVERALAKIPAGKDTCADDRAAQVLAKAKQASGGVAWDGLRSVHVKAKFTTGGLTGTAESWEDTLTGRAREGYVLGPMKGVEGFDGKTVWSQDASGQTNADEGEDTRLRAAGEAYRRTMAYWFPKRGEGLIEYAGEKVEGTRHFHVVRITPNGGRAFDLWIDAETWLFDRIVEKAALETQTTYFSDYRQVAGVKMAFATRRTTGETRYDQTITAESIDINVPIDDAIFMMPAAAPKDFAIAGGRTSTSVPFTLANGHIYLQVKLDGKGPFLFLCDTGGANIVTPEVAKTLGLASAGTIQGRGVGEKSEDVALTKVGKLEVGEASLADQVFAVFPLAGLAEAEGVAAQGLIGYEVFKRFVVEIDYEHGRLTLVTPDAFTYKGGGTAVAFKFNGRIPQVEGEIDGLPGKFDIDTGSRASLTILAPFAAKHNLKERYGAKIEAVTGWGVGGSTRGLITRAGVLKLGGVDVRGPVTELSLQTKGAFIDPYVAGNVGAGVLQRFNLVFDYGRGRIIFEPNANNARPDLYDRSGMWLNFSKGAFQVIDVVAGGPAAEEGLKKGDEILSIEGTPAGRLALAAARLMLKAPPAGTRVWLRVRSGGAERDVTITLRDLID
jgi:thiol-disulfide isomerase/thioredoxin